MLQNADWTCKTWTGLKSVKRGLKSVKRGLKSLKRGLKSLKRGLKSVKRGLECNGNPRVTCLMCGEKSRREDLQEAIRQLNPDWHTSSDIAAPDGDVLLSDDLIIKDFQVPDCLNCGGVLKPDVVFFGDSVPRDRVSLVHKCLKESDAVLALGSSLQVYSAYRFILAAHEQKLPLAIVNIGTTRADGLATLRVHSKIGEIVSTLSEFAV